MGLFGKKIDIKNAEKTTFSEDDLKKLDLTYQKEFGIEMGSNVHSPIKKETPQVLLSQIRDRAFEKILDDHIYTFKHLLVVPNPYSAAVQTALLIFNTSKEVSVHYKILGADENTSFEATTIPSMRHRVPILGLYQGKTNKLIVELIDENGEVYKRRDLSIYVRDIELRLKNIIKRSTYESKSQFPFILINGVHFNPIAIDINKDVRYAMQLKTDRMGMIPLKNGHFLFADRNASIVDDNGNISTCCYHEIDYMGRIYKTFLMEYPIGHVITQHEDKLFLVTSSSSEYIGDVIVCLDMTTGNIVNKYKIEDIIGDKYKQPGDWTGIAHIDYKEDRLLITLKPYHTILQYNIVTNEVEWVIAPEAMWAGTALAKKRIVKKVNEDAEAEKKEKPLLKPDYAEYDKKDEKITNIVTYSTQLCGKINPDGLVSNKASLFSIIEIDTESKQYIYTKNIWSKRFSKFGSVLLDDKQENVLLFQGLVPVNKEEIKSHIAELDLKTGNKTGEFNILKPFNCAWCFEPDIKSYCEGLKQDKNVLFGTIEPPEIYTGSAPQPCEDKFPRKYFRAVRLNSGLLKFAAFPGTVKNVYFIGQENAYKQDYSKLVLSKRRETFAINVAKIKPDIYNICVEIGDKVYSFKDEIRIDKPDESEK